LAMSLLIHFDVVIKRFRLLLVFDVNELLVYTFDVTCSFFPAVIMPNSVLQKFSY
jgi:hypothetical protein